MFQQCEKNYDFDKKNAFAKQWQAELYYYE